MKGYRTVLEVQTRFRDTDAMGHINNAVYLSYLEMARFEYLRKALGITRHQDAGIILARVEIDYRSPAYQGETLVVGIRVSRLGGASFTMEYRIEEKEKKRLVAEAKTVQAAYDYAKGKVRRLTPGFAAATRKYDGLA
jgi:acyl-CoA thioester hydrolase